MNTQTSSPPKPAREHDVERLRQDIDALKNDLAAALETIRGLTSHKIEDVLEKGKHAAESLGDQASDVRDTVEASIRKNPLQAVAIAFGAGIILALLRGR